MVEEATSATTALMLATSGLSLMALFYLFQKHVGGEPLLEYEPRRRVPWGPGVALLAMALPLLSILAFLGTVLSNDPADPSDIAVLDEEILPGEEAANGAASEFSYEEILTMGWTDTVFKLLFVAGMIAIIANLFRADARDLGLPTSWRQLARDMGIGAVAMAAAFLPIYVVQISLVLSLDMKTPHPLIEQIEANQTPQMMLLAVIMAVVVAPLFEEFTFRGLLQGWLERREDEALGYAPTTRTPLCELGPTDEELANVVKDVAEFRAKQIHLAHAEDMQRPARGWLPALPHGWTPILISGVLFGLAHLGHGIAPVPLVLFGIVLGYLYQRTHRLAPSITAHLLFNAYSMVLLWLQLPAAG